MTTYILERPDGVKIEYRRFPWHDTVLHMEHRELRRDGTPHDDTWYRVTDSHLLWIQLQGSDIVRLLAEQGQANYWTEAEAAGDLDPRRCVHGVARNVFCGRCEA